MRFIKAIIIFLAFVSTGVFFSCCGEDPNEEELDMTTIAYDPTAYELMIPDGFPQMEIPADNPLTIDGVSLGRHLFYDPILSIDSSMSCSTCHQIEQSFTDLLPKSPGVDGVTGARSSMSLLNVGFFNNGLFWDGRVNTLEEQAILPIEDPVELHNTWENVEERLARHPEYPTLFRRAFGITKKADITRDLAAKAIAQFERTLISSGSSKYDRVAYGPEVFSDLERDGHDIFFDISEDVSQHAECGHCHNAPLFAIDEYRNNGIDQINDLTEFVDLGRGIVTNTEFENGMFRVPSLRNIQYTAPYMHDGRFNSLDEVIDHYATGGFRARNLAPVLRPLNLTDYNRRALMAFIATLQDDEFIQNPAFSNPFE